MESVIARLNAKKELDIAEYRLELAVLKYLGGYSYTAIQGMLLALGITLTRQQVRHAIEKAFHDEALPLLQRHLEEWTKAGDEQPPQRRSGTKAAVKRPAK